MVSINDTNHANYHLLQNVMLENGFVNMRMRRSPLLTNLRYRDSPFFKTDFDSFDRNDDNKQNNNSNQSADGTCDMEEENLRQNNIYPELFQKQWPKKIASSSCRYLLKQIKDHIYIVNDKTILENVEERLENIFKIMKSHCPTDFGFLIKSSLEKPVNEKRSNSHYEKLSHPRLRKSKFTGRVDCSIGWRKFHSKISVAEDKTPLPERIEGTVPADDNALCDIKFEETGDQMTQSNNYLEEENGIQNLSMKKSLMILMGIRISRSLCCKKD